MATTTADYYFVTCDEVGSKIAGFTVRGQGVTRFCQTMEAVEQVVGSPEAFCWDSLADARVYYTRQPEESWGFATESVTVRHWCVTEGKITESVVERSSVPFDRYDLWD